jgi:hypothetical protein
MKRARRVININGTTTIFMVRLLPYMGPKKNWPKMITAGPKGLDRQSGIVRHGYKG